MEHDEINHLYEVARHSEEEGFKVRKKIWVVFWFLLVVTITEVMITFTSLPKGIINTMLVVMTLVKASCIVAFYMHLIDEVKHLIIVVLIPYCSFILYLLWIALTEANYIHWIMN